MNNKEAYYAKWHWFYEQSIKKIEGPKRGLLSRIYHWVIGSFNRKHAESFVETSNKQSKEHLNYPTIPLEKKVSYLPEKPIEHYAVVERESINFLKKQYRYYHKKVLEIPRGRNNITLLKMDFYLLEKQRNRDWNRFLDREALSDEVRIKLTNKIFNRFEEAFTKWIGEAIGLSHRKNFSWAAREYYVHVLDNKTEELIR